jgi:hypothetical protein
MTTSDKEDSYPERTLPSRVVPPQPAYNPSGWPANPSTPAPSVLTPGQPVAPLAPPPPASFSFGDGPAAQPPQADAGASSLALTTTGPEAQQLEMELAAARDELKALHEMLEDLPEIFERKFQQRLATVMEHQKHLLDDNQALRERLYSLNPAAADGPPPPGSGRPQPLLLPTVARKEGWGQALKKALRLGGPDSNGRPGERSTQKISRHDDGRPITA